MQTKRANTAHKQKHKQNTQTKGEKTMNIIVYFVAEKGFMNREMMELFMEMFTQRGYTIEDIGMGSAYNMPIYLLGEVEEHIEKAVIVSYYMENGRPVPMVFFDEAEVNAVVERLEKAQKGEDSFQILKEVHGVIRNH